MLGRMLNGYQNPLQHCLRKCNIRLVLTGVKRESRTQGLLQTQVDIFPGDDDNNCVAVIVGCALCSKMEPKPFLAVQCVYCIFLG